MLSFCLLAIYSETTLRIRHRATFYQNDNILQKKWQKSFALQCIAFDDSVL